MRIAFVCLMAAFASSARSDEAPPANDTQSDAATKVARIAIRATGSGETLVVEAAVKRAVLVVEKSAAEYRRQRQCFSCHHQALPVLMLTEAANRGFHIDRENLRQQIDHTAAHLKRGLEDYRKGNGQGGRFDTAGWALWTLDIGGYAADDVTEAVADYLLKANSNKDHWSATSNRPPTEASPFTTTYVAIRGLTRYGSAEQQQQIAAGRAAALEWLATAKAADTEDRVFRLRALNYLDADCEVVEAAAHDLLKEQEPDGGWAQIGGLNSDAYATGTTLVALGEADKLPTSDAAYRHGIAFLLANQQQDGSWRVETRSKPIQKYFETGFPHGKDQFISTAATSWAALALLHAWPDHPAGCAKDVCVVDARLPAVKARFHNRIDSSTLDATRIGACPPGDESSGETRAVRGGIGFGDNSVNCRVDRGARCWRRGWLDASPEIPSEPGSVQAVDYSVIVQVANDRTLVDDRTKMPLQNR